MSAKLALDAQPNMLPPDYDVVDAVSSPIGTIYLSRRKLITQPSPLVYEVQIDGHLLMSSLNPVSERKLSTSALELHQGAGDLRVLVIDRTSLFQCRGRAPDKFTVKRRFRAIR